ncbi:EcoKI restriction-modification system protein HsdS [Planctomycetes bacterium CA13]|uniref:EcoKI restriction-modification system protein HsdS n=1 Tax=Novipirellula herctigrandis TaxID=2527986 RepID=A0A5C5Z0T1_9BACT|nr:EcoKI restriction-modification system protein HsdS [Planctomycetes bacterium CA13]
MSKSISWPKQKVASLIENGSLRIDDGYRVRRVELGPEGIPFVRGGDIGKGDISTLVEDHIRSELAERVQTKLARPLDVAFISKGTVGRVGMLRPGQPEVVFSPQVCYWRSLDYAEINPRFLYYLMTSHEFQSELHAVMTHGSMAADYVSLTDQRDFHLTFPPIETQNTIASILGALDDKIEVNRRMNATLESLARAIFKSWFVDFDPVNINAGKINAGQMPASSAIPTTHDPKVLELFPSTFQDSELGPTPEGWEVKRVKEVGNVVCGKTPSTKKPENYGDDVPFITIPDMHGNIFVLSTKKSLSNLGAESQVKKSLPPGAICVSCIATPGLVCITHTEAQTNQQINSVIPNESEQEGFWYWTFCGLGDEIRAGGSGGSVLTNLSKGRFEELKLLVPPSGLRREYTNATKNLFESIFRNLVESQLLSESRDALLPQLLSGELPVPEAFTQAEEVPA